MYRWTGAPRVPKYYKQVKLTTICYTGKVLECWAQYATLSNPKKHIIAGDGVFFVLFTFLNEMFFRHFVKGPKDNFGYLFMKMFGFQGFFQLFFLYNFVPASASFKYLALMNAMMCYVGPQRGELLNVGNVKDAHIVPHVCLMLVSAAFVCLHI